MPQDEGPILASGRRHTEAIVKTRTEKPSSFTVGTYYTKDASGHTVVAQATYDRKWWNGWGATAYARAWWNDTAVIPVLPGAKPPTFGGEVGVEGRYEFDPPGSK